MTRDEAKQNLYYGLQFGILKPNIFIDSIYDEFENKKCINCQNYTKDKGCELTYWIDYSEGYGFECKDDDYCSRWTAK